MGWLYKIISVIIFGEQLLIIVNELLTTKRKSQLCEQIYITTHYQTIKYNPSNKYNDQMHQIQKHNDQR